MSWLFSRALVEEFSEATCSDGAQSALLNGDPTPQAFLSSDRMTAFSRLSRFGMTFKPLTADLGADLLTWYLAVSRAKTSAQPVEALESTGPGLRCGATWPASLAKFDPDSHGWKTAQCSLLGDSDEFLQTFPRWGMTRNGVLSELPKLVPTTNVSESGSLLATPTCTSNQLAPSMMKHAGCRALAQAMLPTPTCHNAKEGDYPAERNRRTPLLATHVGEKIHPHFTEWMMGWPQGWSDLKPLEMDKFQQWLELHSNC